MFSYFKSHERSTKGEVCDDLFFVSAAMLSKWGSDSRA